MENFKTTAGFCPDCGTIFPNLTAHNVICYNCKNEFSPADVFGDMLVEYTIHFNTYVANTPAEKAQMRIKKERDAESDGPTVERKCPKCGHDKMSYATVQLRSADEGQTVFFTCLKCKFKESENS